MITWMCAGPSKSYRKLRVRAGFWSSSGLLSNWIEVSVSACGVPNTHVRSQYIPVVIIVDRVGGKPSNLFLIYIFEFHKSISCTAAKFSKGRQLGFEANWNSFPLKVSGSCRFVIRVRLANLSLRLNRPDFSSQKRPLVWSPHIRIFNMRWGELYYGKSVQNIYG